jgi:hypothetical protein
MSGSKFVRDMEEKPMIVINQIIIVESFIW